MQPSRQPRTSNLPLPDWPLKANRDCHKAPLFRLRHNLRCSLHRALTKPNRGRHLSRLSNSHLNRKTKAKLSLKRKFTNSSNHT